jgi:hypothetical protein
VNPGRTRSILSFAAKLLLSSKLKEIGDALKVTAFVSVSVLVINDGATRAGEMTIGVAGIFATAARVAEAVRVFKFAACAEILVVTPVAIVTVH